MTGNLALWETVERTPEKETKPITGKAYKGNSPKPHYLIRKATETFGPCGIGWGFEIADEKLLDGALIAPGFYERIHMARVRVWYDWEGKRGVVEHVGQTAFSGKRNNGNIYTDEDAPKKSVTDALVKALSMLGFAGDIFSGRYDDTKYMAELRAEERLEREAPATTKAGPQHPQQTAGGSNPIDLNEVVAYVASVPTTLLNHSSRAEVMDWFRSEAQRRSALGINKETKAYGDIVKLCEARVDEIVDEAGGKFLRAG